MPNLLNHDKIVKSLMKNGYFTEKDLENIFSLGNDYGPIIVFAYPSQQPNLITKQNGKTHYANGVYLGGDFIYINMNLIDKYIIKNKHYGYDEVITLAVNLYITNVILHETTHYGESQINKNKNQNIEEGDAYERDVWGDDKLKYEDFLKIATDMIKRGYQIRIPSINQNRETK